MAPFPTPRLHCSPSGKDGGTDEGRPAPMKDVTPLIEHEPIADAKTETDMIRFADAGETVTNRDDVTKRTASRNGSDPVTKPPDVTKPTPPVTKPNAKGGRSILRPRAARTPRMILMIYLDSAPR